MLPIVLLAKQLAKLIDHGIVVLGAPPALGGVLIALIVFAPEATAALRAALDNQLQRSINLCLGASASTIGLTVPAILGVSIATGKTMVLGLDPTGVTLLALTLAQHAHFLRTEHNRSRGNGAPGRLPCIHNLNLQSVSTAMLPKRTTNGCIFFIFSRTLSARPLSPTVATPSAT
jgi:type IV secretory pathway VirB2 component (pilin)